MTPQKPHSYLSRASPLRRSSRSPPHLPSRSESKRSSGVHRPVTIPWGALLRTRWPKMAIFVQSRASPRQDGSMSTPRRPVASHSKRSSRGLVVVGVWGGNLQAKNTPVVLSTAFPPDSTPKPTPPRQTGANFDQSSPGLQSARPKSKTPAHFKGSKKFFPSPQKSKKKSLRHITTVGKSSSRNAFLSGSQRHFGVRQKIEHFLKEIFESDRVPTRVGCVSECCVGWSQGIYHVIQGQARTCDLEFRKRHFSGNCKPTFKRRRGTLRTRKNPVSAQSRGCALNKKGCVVQSRAQTPRDTVTRPHELFLKCSFE